MPDTPAHRSPSGAWHTLPAGVYPRAPGGLTAARGHVPSACTADAATAPGPAAASAARPVPRHSPAGALHTPATSRHPPHGPRPGAGRPSCPEGAGRSGPRPGPARGAACRLSPGRLSPAGRWAGVLPILRCPAPVSWAGGVLPSRPSPGPWLSHARRPRLDTTPPRQTAAFPVHRAPHLPASKCHTVVSVPAASWVRVSPAVPEALLTLLPPFPPTGTDGASHVRRRLAACLPRPEASGGPSPPRPRGGSCGAFGAREHPRRPPPAHVEAVPARQGARSPLRPAGCSVDASPVVFATCCCLRPRRKTRDEWGAHPYPTGTFPRHDTPSFLGASTLGVRRWEEREQGTSGRCSQSAARPCWAESGPPSYGVPPERSPSASAGLRRSALRCTCLRLRLRCDRFVV